MDAWGRFASNSRSRSLINISHIQYYMFFSCHEAQQLEKAYMAKKFCVCLTSTTRIACKSPPSPLQFNNTYYNVWPSAARLSPSISCQFGMLATLMKGLTHESTKLYTHQEH